MCCNNFRASCRCNEMECCLHLDEVMSWLEKYEREHIIEVGEALVNSFELILILDLVADKLYGVTSN